MSSGRGRGYTGRHHIREPRPGDLDNDDVNAVRTLTELSPRSTEAKLDGDAKEEAAQEETGDDDSLHGMLTVDEQFTPLLTLLEQFTPGEDGIQFNRKLRQFETTVTELCPDETRLQQAFATFRAAALQSSVTSRKLATVGAAFTRQQRQGLLRASLLNVMQATFTKLEVLERSNPLYLINAANLMGDYFAEARLCNGKKVHILAGPLVHYMRALLASDDIRAHRSLATQLMQNGRELLSILSQELDELSISIRLRLLTPPPVSIIWLLLSADLCLNKFLPLPNSLQQFYASHLDLTSDESFSEVSYGSWKKDIVTEKVQQSISQMNLGQEDDAKPKLRPILGAGAGLLRQEQQDFDTWSTKSSLTKRYDLNSWRQDEKEEPAFNPSVPPPNYQEFPYNYQENFYLQQGDGTYITQQNVNTNVEYPEKVNNEVQKACRKDDNDDKKYKSKDSLNDDEKFRSGSRNSSRQKLRRNSSESADVKARRHVSDVPRNHKYWDHDDRCDKDYNS